MDKSEKELKILFVRQVFETSLANLLKQHNIDKHNFYKGKVSDKKIDALFDGVYNEIGKYLLMGTLINTGKLNSIADVPVKKGGTKNEK